MSCINKIMCLGGLCEGHIFCDTFGKRVKGPVDNIEAYDFRAILDLFNGKLFKDILNDNISKTEINPLPHDFDDDIYMRHYGQWMTVHHDFRIKDRKEKFKLRIQAFKDYLNKAKIDNNLYFVYSISFNDHLLTEDDINKVIKLMPKFVLNKLIIVNGLRVDLPEVFKKKFRCITYNHLIGSPNYIDVLWRDILL